MKTRWLGVAQRALRRWPARAVAATVGGVGGAEFEHLGRLEAQLGVVLGPGEGAGHGVPASSVRVNAASVLARSIGMEKVTVIGCSIRTLSRVLPARQRARSSGRRCGSGRCTARPAGRRSCPPGPAFTVTLYAVDAASPSSGREPVDAGVEPFALAGEVGVMARMAPGRPLPVATGEDERGNDRPVEGDVMALSTGTSSVPSAGWVLVTSRKPAVTNLNETGCWQLQAGGAGRAVGQRHPVLGAALQPLGGREDQPSPCTLTSPATFGSMLKAALVLAGSIGWSKVIITGAASTCSSPRSGLDADDGRRQRRRAWASGAGVSAGWRGWPASGR